MWFIRLFIVLIGVELLYMVVTQETTTFIRHGYSYTLALKHHPARFGLLLLGLAAFEVFLVKMHIELGREGRGRKRKNASRAVNSGCHCHAGKCIGPPGQAGILRGAA